MQYQVMLHPHHANWKFQKLPQTHYSLFLKLIGFTDSPHTLLFPLPTCPILLHSPLIPLTIKPQLLESQLARSMSSYVRRSIHAIEAKYVHFHNSQTLKKTAVTSLSLYLYKVSLLLKTTISPWSPCILYLVNAS